jgi:chromosome segregation ATPase
MLIAQSQETSTVRISRYFNARLMLLEGIDTNKRHKSSHLQSGNTPATLTSIQATYVSENMMDPFMMEFEEHKRILLGLREEETLAYRQEIAILKRLLETKAQEKTASRQQIERLQAQQNLKEEQTLVLQSQLAKTETEAKEWKARYRKLGVKVQSFVDGI